MKKAAILAPYFLPRRRVGAWRPYKFAIHLRAFGWEPHIITIHEPNESLTQREAELLSDISVFKIKSPFDLTHKIGHQLEYGGKFAKATSNGSDKGLFNQILAWVDDHIPIDTWRLLFMFKKKRLKHTLKKWTHRSFGPRAIRGRAIGWPVNWPRNTGCHG